MRRRPPTKPGAAPRKKNPPVRKPYQRCENASAETVPQANGENRTTIYISEGGVPGAGDLDSCANGGPAMTSSRLRCRRAGALSVERWGQVKSDYASAKRPRSAGCLSQARWHTAVDTASNSQRPIVIEALPPNKTFASNAHHASSALPGSTLAPRHSPNDLAGC